MVNTEKEKIMSQLMTQLLERLAEMFPKQNYQSRLENYLSTKCVQSESDIEYWSREYDKHHDRNFAWNEFLNQFGNIYKRTDKCEQINISNMDGCSMSKQSSVPDNTFFTACAIAAMIVYLIIAE